MAVFLAGKTNCVLCQKPIVSSSDAIGFPAFIPAGHVLSEFSDSVFHTDCFENWEKRDELTQLHDRYQEIWNARPDDLTFQEMESWGKEAFSDLFASGMVESSS